MVVVVVVLLLLRQGPSPHKCHGGSSRCAERERTYR